MTIKIKFWLWALIILLNFFGTIGMPKGAYGFAYQQTKEDSVRIYVHAGGIHSDIILPLSNMHRDWNLVLEKPKKTELVSQDWIAFGWGSRLFYLNAPSWAQTKLKHMVGGFLGIGGAAYHIQKQTEPVASEFCKSIVLSADEYSALCIFLDDCFDCATLPRKMIAYKTGKPWDAFYAAKGYYFFLNNCNTWTNKALQSCGRSKRRWVGSYLQLFDALS